MDGTETRLMTADELAKALAVSLATIRRLTRDSQIPAVRIRSLVRYDFDAVKARLAAGHSSSSLMK